ncbi:MAG: 16S rRNA (uracil(1498)-N(3))-methyltransferase [Akkermansiaceae bacterium]
MNRYHLPSEQWSGDMLVLTGDEAKHCARVMRATIGETVELFDGAGRSAICQIESISNQKIHCQIQSQEHLTTGGASIHLCQAIPKGGNMELIVQKAVELGVASIQPIITEHTVARPEQVEKKRLKWQRIALEACKQCGQNTLPEVKPVLSFGEWITQPHEGARVIAAIHPQARSMQSVVPHLAEGASLLVGPEGDFSLTEYELALDNGFMPVTLGNIILRTETATLYCLSVLQYELRGKEE